MKPIHGAPKNWRIEELKKHYRGYTEEAPEGCTLKLGDKVRYTNPYGAVFDLVVKGFTAKSDPTSTHLSERTVYIFNDCYWFPVKPEECKLIA